MIKRLVIALLLIIVSLMVLTAAPVYAIDDPDTAPQVLAVYVYEFTDGSVGVLVDYYLDYSAPYPDETATEAYLAVFIDTDGTTQLSSVAPYTFVDSGYGRGLAWIPFTATEATTYGLNSANIALYRVWLTGNPTLAWTGDPPKTTTTLDQWVDTNVSDTFASRILYYADVLEIIWSLDMVEYTSDGNKLTTVGASYFENVIPGCRELAPGAFSDATSSPDYMSISYNTAFGATATSGTATVAGSPQTLTEGADSINTGATTGTFVVSLAQWTSGNITQGTGVLLGGPTIHLYPGTNTLTATANGTFITALEVIDSATIYEDTVTGTGFDLTALATIFGMSRWMLSGLIWMGLTIVLCAAAYVGANRASLGDDSGASKIVMILFAIMIVGGMLLGLLHPLVVSFVLIAYGAFIGYILFFRSETLHKGFMFMIWMFVITSIAGNIAASGQSGITVTRLTANITANETDSISVASTVGFPDAGIILIGDEQITYPDKDGTHFLDATFNDITRGGSDTEAAAHSVNASVRTKESYLLNASIDYKIARITDSAGILAFIAMPVLLLDLVLTFFVLPLGFLGTDMAILTYIWMIVAIGMIVGFVVTLAGGRRV